VALISTEDAKAYLRVDSSDEDATVGILLASAIRLCIDIARLTDDQWEVIDSDAASSDEYTEAELSAIRVTMKVAILYTCAYLFEHRKEADHHALTMTLRSIFLQYGRSVFMEYSSYEGASHLPENTGHRRQIRKPQNGWADYFSCWATVGTSSGSESSGVVINPEESWTSPAATALSSRMWNRQNTGSSRKAAPTTSPM
jgi:hypothetical protein